MVKTTLTTIALTITLSAVAYPCTVDSNGTTRDTCSIIKTSASIQDLRDAIAGGAITAGDMANA